MVPTTVDELRAAMACAPGDAPVLLVLHDPPRAGWLGVVRYDPGAHTLDLHCTDAQASPSGPIPVVPVQSTHDAAYPRSCT